MVQGRIFRDVILFGLTVLTVSWAQAGEQSQAQEQPQFEAVPGEYLIKLKDTKFLKSFSSPAAAFGAEKFRTVSKENKIYLVKRNILEKAEYAVAQLNAQPAVELIEPNYIYRINAIPNDPSFSELWGLKNVGLDDGTVGVDIGAEAAWDIQTGSRKVVVAVIDTGINYNHPDLKDNMWVNAVEQNGVAGVDDDNNGYVDDIHGYDFANNDGDPIDDQGHGSHCSGTIGAKGNDAQGIVGVNWEVSLMAVKFLTDKGSGTLENALKAIDYATKNGAHIQSNSWGGGAFTQLLKEAIERARDKNILFVAAAGNDGKNNDDEPKYPASYDVKNIISVAAIDKKGLMAEFSNYGKSTVDIAAPGVDIYSSVHNDSLYKLASGTSMATPHVAGVAALVVAQEPGISYKDLKARLVNSAKPLASTRKRVNSYGVVNAFYALTDQRPSRNLEDPYYWTKKRVKHSSGNPYKENSNISLTVQMPAAKEVSVYFSKFETEVLYDRVEFLDGAGHSLGFWSGKHNKEYSPTAKGDTIVLKFTSDESVNEFGYKISKVAFK